MPNKNKSDKELNDAKLVCCSFSNIAIILAMSVYDKINSIQCWGAPAGSKI